MLFCITNLEAIAFKTRFDFFWSEVRDKDHTSVTNVPCISCRIFGNILLEFVTQIHLKSIIFVILQNWVGTCWCTFVRSVSLFFLSVVCPAVSIEQSQATPAHTRRWPNAGLIFAHRLRRWANISPVLGHCVLFGITLNVGQCHRRRPNINPALVQSIVLVQSVCRCNVH